MKTIYPSKRKPLSGSSRKEIAGLSNAELAARAGVSVRTVQRYKAGTSLNKKVMEEIVKEYDVQLKEKQIKLKEYIGEDKTTPLLSKIELLRGQDFLNFKNKTGLELEKTIKKVEKILESQTITAEGYEKWKDNVRTAAEKTFGFTGERLTSAISAFNKLMEDDITRTYLESKYNKGRQFDSKQRVETINKIFSDKRYKGDYDRIYENVREKAKIWYEKNVKEEEELWER